MQKPEEHRRYYDGAEFCRRFRVLLPCKKAMKSTRMSLGDCDMDRQYSSITVRDHLSRICGYLHCTELKMIIIRFSKFDFFT